MGSDLVTNSVRELRKARGITQEDLGTALEVSRQTIISIERERYIPSLPLALKIAVYFGRPVEAIFSLKKDRA